MDTSTTRLMAVVREQEAPPDPREESWANAVIDLLSRPQPIDVVEGVEVILKAQWRDLLVSAKRDSGVSADFSAAFRRLGMFVKYKPYGIKFAAPFGYSIFVLRDGMGFSVQLHQAAKVEAFHILKCRNTAFAVMADEHAWGRSQAAFIANWREGILTEGELGFRPRVGDVLVIRDLRVVHTILGCVLEEYATTSNDAVLRLYDQNARSDLKLPRRLPLLREALQGTDAIPRQRVERKHDGWSRSEIDSLEVTEIVSMPNQGLSGYHISLNEKHAEQIFPGDPGSVRTLCCLTGGATVEVAGSRFALVRGDTVPIAPGEPLALSADSTVARVALASVRTELAFADLRNA